MYVPTTSVCRILVKWILEGQVEKLESAMCDSSAGVTNVWAAAIYLYDDDAHMYIYSYILSSAPTTQKCAIRESHFFFLLQENDALWSTMILFLY